ncbi:putative G-protein coupled receptor [Apostichopus japonicus]|uniref:Putative G-protein coupled receptor n=1 Tax=Stichopus japonicus TaxID=307972 RepID=A0A2G8LD15_STIJA|nr:putative G-protein coupled receptor [Apostichopus japonicus]
MFLRFCFAFRHLYHNNIEHIEPEAFPQNVGLLSLKGNKIQILREGIFYGMTKLHHLNLQDNRITYIEDNVFENLTNLQDLNLENNNLIVLNASTFSGLENLKYIHLTFNKLTSIQDTAFQHLPKLQYIDLSGNPLVVIEPGAFTSIESLETLLIQSTDLQIHDKDITNGLQSLQLLVADNFGICCLLSPDTECNTPPSAFATCEGIFRTPLLRASAWIVSLCALVGNFIVLIMRVTNKRRIRGVNPANIQNRFISNLAFADLLMGLYLFILAISDARFGSDYFLHSKEWRDGAICKTIGFIGVLSSIASVLILTIVTLDRFLCVVFPFGKVHFHSTSAYIAVAVVWFVATVLALTPVLLADKLDGFYGLSDVCLGLPLVTDAKELSTRWIQDDLSGYRFEFVESEERQGWIYSRFCLFTSIRYVLF